MNRRTAVALSGGVMAGLAQAQPAAPPKTHLKVGDMAPDFTLATIAGKPVSLKDFKGQKGVVLAFFPAAFTGG